MRHPSFALPIRGVPKTSENILTREIRKVREYFFLGHSGGEIGEDVINGNANTANTRLTAPLSRFNGNDVLVVHGCQFTSAARFATFFVDLATVATSDEQERCGVTFT